MKHGNVADLSVTTMYLRFRQSLKNLGFAWLSITSQMIVENEPSV